MPLNDRPHHPFEPIVRQQLADFLKLVQNDDRPLALGQELLRKVQNLRQLLRTDLPLRQVKCNARLSRGVKRQLRPQALQEPADLPQLELNGRKLAIHLLHVGGGKQLD